MDRLLTDKGVQEYCTKKGYHPAAWSFRDYQREAQDFQTASLVRKETGEWISESLKNTNTNQEFINKIFTGMDTLLRGEQPEVK